jgi:sporadic carbohydrate cluster 2OG-Fe(II) oxygenase
MVNYISKDDTKVSSEFEKNGFIIKEAADLDSLKKIKKIFIQSIKKNIKKKIKFGDDYILNNFHKLIKTNELNNFRLKIINDVNSNQKIRKIYYEVAKPYLDILVGNELAMQLRINLSIQMPGDSSSLLPIHSDVWSGDSPFEIVVWIPLVNCYKTKAMYILPPKKMNKVKKIFLKKKIESAEEIFKSIKKNVTWLNVNYGQVLLFNQCLPHGNRINKEKETRWSLNCRFKGVFTPYRDKKIGEFFEPITLRKISQLAIKYNLPKLK